MWLPSLFCSWGNWDLVRLSNLLRSHCQSADQSGFELGGLDSRAGSPENLAQVTCHWKPPHPVAPWPPNCSSPFFVHSPWTRLRSHLLFHWGGVGHLHYPVQVSQLGEGEPSLWRCLGYSRESLLRLYPLSDDHLRSVTHKCSYICGPVYGEKDYLRLWNG